MYNGYPQYNPYMMNQYRQMNYFDSLQFVNGKESAENYIMPPNSKVILMNKKLLKLWKKQKIAVLSILKICSINRKKSISV